MKSIRLDFSLIKTFIRDIYTSWNNKTGARRSDFDYSRLLAWRNLPLEKKFISNVRSILLSISEFKTRQAYPGGQRFREPEAH